ncbi:MAG: glycosyltransferase family 9 protein [Anaerolineae bacterium]|nr:glycosyltransferase family 9 protein [Gemmatimonadaceae bacterium]
MRSVAKSLESAGKTLLLGLVSAFLSRPRALPDWRSRQYRVLYVRHDGIGDMILATGTIRAIARSHPTLKLDVLTHTKTADMLQGNPYLDHVIAFKPGRRLAYPTSVLRSIRRRRYDVVVDGMMRRFVDGAVQRPRVKSSTVWLMAISGAPHRIGMGGRPNDFIYTNAVIPPSELSVHHAEYCAAVAVPFGVNPARVNLDCELHISDAERQSAEAFWKEIQVSKQKARLLVNVSAANERRRWPLDRYISVIQHVLARKLGAVVVVIGAPGEEADILSVASASRCTAHVPGLREAFALVATADVLLTPETSLGHAAAALGTPVVVLLPAGHEMLVPYQATGRNLFGADGTIGSVSAESATCALDEVMDALA